MRFSHVPMLCSNHREPPVLPCWAFTVDRSSCGWSDSFHPRHPLRADWSIVLPNSPWVDRNDLRGDTATWPRNSDNQRRYAYSYDNDCRYRVTPSPAFCLRGHSLPCRPPLPCLPVLRDFFLVTMFFRQNRKKTPFQHHLLPKL